MRKFQSDYLIFIDCFLDAGEIVSQYFKDYTDWKMCLWRKNEASCYPILCKAHSEVVTIMQIKWSHPLSSPFWIPQSSCHSGAMEAGTHCSYFCFNTVRGWIERFIRDPKGENQINSQINIFFCFYVCWDNVSCIPDLDYRHKPPWPVYVGLSIDHRASCLSGKQPTNWVISTTPQVTIL